MGMKKETQRKENNNSRASLWRSDTRIGTIEEKYEIDLGVRPDMKLGTFLKRQGYPSLSAMLENE